jgi:ribonuclease HI
MSVKLILSPYTDKVPAEKEANVPHADLLVYLDGSCNPNPGGVMYLGLSVEFKGEVIFEDSSYCGTGGTNNEAELHAFVRAAQILRRLFATYPQYKVPAHFISDSRIVVTALQGARPFQSENLSELTERFHQQLALLSPRPRPIWVERKHNVAADRLSKAHKAQRRKDDLAKSTTTAIPPQTTLLHATA